MKLRGTLRGGICSGDRDMVTEVVVFRASWW